MWTVSPLQNPSQTLAFPATSAGTLFIGVYNLQYFWNGAMDELRIWNVQRTQSQLQANLYNELAGNEAGLVAYYNFNEGIAGGNNTSVTTLYDNQTNTPAHNGTLTGFALTGTASNWITSGALIHYPEIDIQGNSVSIVDGDNTPSASDHTTFGDILVGANLVRTYTIKNTGSEVLNVSSIGSSNPLFTVGTLTPASPIPVGQSATFTVTFAPLAIGTETATITVNNDDCNEAVYDFAVTGNGANVGAALKFDGVDDYVDLGTSFGNFGTNDFTLETWFKTTQNSSNYVGLLSKRSPCNHDNFWNIVMVNGKIHFEIDENGANYLDLITPLAYNDGNWHHVACVRSGTSLKIYMDGSLVTSGNTSGTTNLTNATSVKMGQSPCGNFIGDLDEVRIWNTARTCEEIKQLYNCELAGNEPNLTAYYKFNQGLAVSDNSGIPNLTDSSPNGYNGTFQNMPRTGSTSNFITPGGVTTGTSCSAVVAPEINVKGNMVSIPDGNTTTSPTDHTDFGNVTVNTTLVRTFTIENTGNNPLTIASISSSNPLFTVGNLSPASPIVANGTATFTVTFVPTATGVQNATITINSNDCDEATYDFAVKATGECDATASIANTNNPICSGNNAVFNLSGTSGAIVTYNLNNTPNTVTLTGGMATVTVTGATTNQTLNLVSVNNGTCSINVTGNATVTVKPLPMVSTPLSSVCVGSTITLSPTSGGTWSSSDDTKATVTSTGVVTGIASGSVTFTFTETASGCSNTTSSVTVNPKPTSVVSGGGIVCAGETLPNVSIELTGTGPWNLTYSNGTSSTPVTGINSSPYVITGAGAGTYTVTALGDANCTGTSMTGSASVVVNPQPTLTAGTLTNPTTCGGTNGSIAFTSTNLPNGTYQLNYTGAGSPKMITVSNNAFTLSGLSAGNYSNFSITNLGCTGTFATTQSLSDPAAPTLAAGTITNPSTCGGTNGSIAFTSTNLPNGTYQLNYTGAGSPKMVTVSNNAFTLSGLSAGNYSNFSITNLGCTGTFATTQSLSDPAAPTLAAGTITNPSTCGGTNGSIAFTSTNLPNGTYQLNYTGAGSPKMVTVSNNTFTLGDLSAGNYSNFSITNLSCTGTFATTQSLSDPAAPTLAAGTITNPSTCGGTNGSIAFTSTNLPNGTYTLSYSGTGSPKMVTVSNNAFTLSGLSAGNYSNFSITNLGCTGTFATTQSLSDPAAPTLSAGTITNPSTCGGTNGSIAFTSTNLPNGTYTLSYSGTGSPKMVTVNNNAFTLNGLSAGNYSNFSVTNLGCTGTLATTQSLSDPSAPTLMAGTIINPTTCGGTNGSIAFTTTNLPNGSYTLNYSGTDSPKMVTVNNNAFTLNGLSAGNYSNFSITNLGCTGTLATTQSLSDPSAPTLTAGTLTNPTTCGGTNGSIAFSTTNLPNGNYTLNYSGTGSPKMVTVNNNTFTLNGLSAGNYSNFSITNLGCTGTFATSQSLSNPPLPTGNIIISGPTVVCQNAPFPTITFTGNGGNAPYTFTYNTNQINLR
jgi:predicted nucleic-acid-binding Zn-ribbon protein